MATKQGKKDNRISDKEAMQIAETTGVTKAGEGPGCGARQS